MQSPDGATENALHGENVDVVLQARTISVQGGIHHHQRERPRPVPRQLPSATLYFTDREKPLASLGAVRRRALDGRAPLVAVCVGPAGIGKSELAARFFATIAEDVPGAHLHADLAEGGTRTAADVLRQFLRALGERPGADYQTDGELSATFRSLTAERPVAVHLDNATLASQVRPLIPNSPGSVVVVTARAPLPNLPGAVEIPVAAMDAEAARSLLDAVVGPALDTIHERDVEAVLQLCAGRPFTLCTAARRLSSLAADERSIGFAVGRWGTGDVVTAILDEDYDNLAAPGATLYRRLGALPVPTFTGAAAAATGDIDDVGAGAGPALDDLCRAGLVTDDGRGRFRISNECRTHARSKASRTEHDAALRRLLEWYLRAAAEADHALMPGRWRLGPAFAHLRAEPVLQPDTARAWLEAERPALRAAVRTAAERGWADLAVQLVEAQWALCFLGKYHDHWIEVHQSALRVVDGASDARFAGRVHAQLGFAFSEQGRFDEAAAEFTAAREADRSAAHARGEATAVESLGLLLLRRCGAEDVPALETGRPDLAAEALELLTDNLRLNRSNPDGDDRATALALRHQGRARSAVGDDEEAEQLLRTARERLAELPDPYNEGKTLTDLGRALIRAGRPTEAQEPLARALDLLPARRHPVECAAALELLAAAAERDGDRDAARELVAAASSLLQGRSAARVRTLTEWAARLGSD